MRRFARSAIVTTALAVLLVAAFLGAPGFGAPRQTQPSSVIVSLGDSFSSGEANPPFEQGTNTSADRCHRSSRSWPRLLGVRASEHFACSGAVLDDLFSATKPSPDDVPQMERLRTIAQSITVKAVVITIGGNDVGFRQVLSSCRTPLHRCLTDVNADRSKIDGVAARIAGVAIPAIKAAAPGARVLLVGYPRLFPEEQDETTHCGWLSDRERVQLNELASYLDQKQGEAAQQAGVEFISVLDRLDGHELCSRDPWLWPISILNCGPGSSPRTNQFCGHPIESDDAHGQLILAKRVRQVLNSVSVAPSTRLDGQSAVTTDEFGPVQFGTSLAAAQAASGLPWDLDSDFEGCAYYTVRGGPAGAAFMVIDGIVVRVDIDGPAVRTKSGLGVGTSEAEILRLFPTAAVTPHEYQEGGHYVTITDRATGNKVVFETDGNTVTRYRAGVPPAVEYVEGCV